MITIHKYEIEPYRPETLMPKDAEILTVANQGNKLFIWAKVDTENRFEKRKFYTIPTGGEIEMEMPVDWNYVGTGFTIDGLVHHVFAELPIQAQTYRSFYSLLN